MTIFFGILFGAIGGVYAVYAKRTYSASYLVCGVLLMLFPYFVDGIVLTLIVGAALVIVPIALSKGWFDRS